MLNVLEYKAIQSLFEKAISLKGKVNQIQGIVTVTLASLHRADWSVLGVEEEKQKFLFYLHYFLWSYVSYLLSAMKYQKPVI